MKHKSARGLPSDNGWRKTPRWFYLKKKMIFHFLINLKVTEKGFSFVNQTKNKSNQMEFNGPKRSYLYFF